MICSLAICTSSPFSAALPISDSSPRVPCPAIFPTAPAYHWQISRLLRVFSLSGLWHLCWFLFIVAVIGFVEKIRIAEEIAVVVLEVLGADLNLRHIFSRSGFASMCWEMGYLFFVAIHLYFDWHTYDYYDFYYYTLYFQSSLVAYWSHLAITEQIDNITDWDLYCLYLWSSVTPVYTCCYCLLIGGSLSCQFSYPMRNGWISLYVYHLTNPGFRMSGNPSESVDYHFTQ